MPAGYNLRLNVYRITTPTDDEVGGALITGTLLHENVPARIEHRDEEMLLLQQGYESPQILTVLCQYFNDIQEKDQFEITSPYNHFYIGKRFRIIVARPSSLSPSRPGNHLLLTATRSDYAHTDAIQ